MPASTRRRNSANSNSRNYNPLHRWRSSRVATSPVSYECILETTLSFGKNQLVIFGRILNAHVEDRFVIDAEQALIDTPGLALVDAMHGAKWYSRMSDLFSMDRPTWKEWIGRGKVR